MTPQKYETQTRLGVTKPSRIPIAPISLPSGPFYRPVTITLYNTCHRISTLCEASQGYFGNLAGPVLTQFTDVRFTSCRSTCQPSWCLDLRLHLFSLIEAFPVSSLGRFHTYLLRFPFTNSA
jgi:hypothetical protein